MKNKRPLLLGTHMSISGGFEKALARGESIGCIAIQIFTKNNKQWRAKPISHDEASLFKKATKNSTIESVTAHASYLINIGSSNQKIAEMSQDALLIELQRCDQLAIPYLVLHPGASTFSSLDDCIARIANTINSIFDNYQGPSKIILENTAGQGTNVGYSFRQLEQIYKQIKEKNRIGFCFDTCHAFAAGYNFDSKISYEKMWSDFDAILGINNLKVIHINDSKKECGSRIDRHEHIGKGKIGLEWFKLLLNDKRFSNIPKILETPKENDLEADKMNIETIYSLLNQKTNFDELK